MDSTLGGWREVSTVTNQPVTLCWDYVRNSIGWMPEQLKFDNQTNAYLRPMFALHFSGVSKQKTVSDSSVRLFMRVES